LYRFIEIDDFNNIDNNYLLFRLLYSTDIPISAAHDFSFLKNRMMVIN